MTHTHMHAPKQGDSHTTNTLCVKVAADADLHAANLTNWQQEYDQTSGGHFEGKIVELEFGDLQVFCESTSQALQQRCLVWPDSVWLGIPLAQQAESRVNGLSIRRQHIMCRPGNTAFELTTPNHYDLFGIVINQHTLVQTADAHGITINWHELSHHGRLAIPEHTLSNVRYILSRLLDTDTHTTPRHANRLSYDLVMIAVLEVLAQETPQPPTTSSYAHRKQVVDKARQFVAHHLDTPLTITDLCAVANVSRRTLQYSFESILGISPIQHLRISRLNGVRRAIITSSKHHPILDIAAQWGFWHMSQFAKDYKKLFGELPSQTPRIKHHESNPTVNARTYGKLYGKAERISPTLSPTEFIIGGAM